MATTSATGEAADPIAAFERACVDVERIGDTIKLRELAENALARAAEAHDIGLEARARGWLAHAHLYRGALTESLADAARAESLAVEVHDWLVAARMHAIVGNCEFMLPSTAQRADSALYGAERAGRDRVQTERN